VFEECKLEGSFILSSGKKSNVFYDFDLLSPHETAQYVKQLVNNIPANVFEEIGFVACPALGGIIPGFLVAFAKNKPLVIVDKEGKVRGPEFKTGKYLIIDDVITSFGAANRVRSALGEGNVACGVGAYIFRGSWADLEKQDYPAFFLARKEQEE
jgi:orotate phosphoribosyltransferase